jgi:transglutaminase-like putative cysteine protease
LTKTSLHCVFAALPGLLSLLLLNGCAGHRLLTTEPPAASATAGGEENRTLLYERIHRFTTDGALTIRTHTIVRVGSSGTEDLLDVFDNSVEKLTAFEARIIHADRSVDWYGKGDLGNYSLSNRRTIAEQSLRFVYIDRPPRSGDLIEIAYEHDLALPGLGTWFSTRWAGGSPVTVRCVFELPFPDTLLYRVLNDSLAPGVTRKDNVTEYAFTWNSPAAQKRRSVYAKSNDEPAVIAVDPARGPATWKALGDWYLDLMQDRFIPDEGVTAEARRVTQAAATDVEKMKAIAEFCQSKVRYEQVYLPRGEFIPNPAPRVLAKRFGDCKDYSCLIVSMARAVGLDAHPALCHRGRMFDVCEDLPVDQFNHMIAHYRSGGRDFWYDGTNQSGTPGTTTDDMVNARVLILEKGNSRMARIPESEENLFSVGGTLHAKGSSLAGQLDLTLAGQYAVLFQYYAKWENDGNMRSLLVSWLKRELADRLTVTGLSWTSAGGTFEIHAAGEIPNSVVTIDGTAYLRFDRVFDNLLPPDEPGAFSGIPFEYPRYARVAIGLDIPEFNGEGGKAPFHWEFRYAVAPGPFSPEERAAFPGSLHDVRTKFGQTFKFPGKG